MPIHIGRDTLLTAAAIRQKLALWHEVNANNTPHLQTVTDELIKTYRRFDDLAAVRDEVKRRSFGARHVAAMEVLRQDQAQLVNAYMTQQGISRTDLLSLMDRLSKAYGTSNPNANQRVLRRQGNRPPRPSPTFIFWGAASYFEPAQANNRVLVNKQMYRWITRQANAPNPIFMNCWESVLYSGCFLGAGQALYTRDYAFWALVTSTIPASTFNTTAHANAAIPANRVPRFIRHVVEHPSGHTTCIDRDNVGGKPRIPKELTRGMVVVLGCGSHVALATGTKRRIASPAARAIYGDTGHGILELDGPTLSVERNTIEDAIARGGSYGNEIHVGWLPEVPANTPNLVFGNLTRQMPATHFYS